MQKPDIFEILEYSEPFHNCIPTHIQNLVIFTKIGKPCVNLYEQGIPEKRAPGRWEDPKPYEGNELYEGPGPYEDPGP